MHRRFATALLVAMSVACSGPTTPPPPPDTGPATAPVIRAITVPTSRVEVGQDITITATVEDAETPLTQLSYQWATSAGTITGSGTTATWTMPAGITSGVNVVITLTVVDTYSAVLNNQIVQRQFTVVGTSSPFRVHDSVAETKELARKFLIDLFGNSAVPVEACLVDFTEFGRCAGTKAAERSEIEAHRRDYVVVSATMLDQRVDQTGPDTGLVTSAVRYIDSKQGAPAGQTCTDFYLTTVYIEGRWWLCESTISKDAPPPICGNSANTGGVYRVFSGKSGGNK